MPQLKNLARIKDTATGKYLMACGMRRSSWRRAGYFCDVYQRRNNSWSAMGIAYKKSHIPSALRDASLALAWRTADREKRIPVELNNRPEGVDWSSPEATAWREARESFAQQLEGLVEIPDTWVVEEFVVSAENGGQTPAREWHG